MEDHRAARVDILLHCPQDSRDVLALQRQALSVRPDATSWLHGEKRLGGHAFAGYGIFGHSSSADRADQALAELHTDMTVTYLRLEIQYAIQQKRARTAFKIIDTKPPGTAAITPKSGIKMKDPGSDNLALAPLSTLNAENLSCISFLKSVCGKNCYTKSLLYMELARVEEGTDTRAEYLQVSGDRNPRFKVLQYYYLKNRVSVVVLNIIPSFDRVFYFLFFIVFRLQCLICIKLFSFVVSLHFLILYLRFLFFFRNLLTSY